MNRTNILDFFILPLLVGFFFGLYRLFVIFSLGSFMDSFIAGFVLSLIAVILTIIIVSAISLPNKYIYLHSKYDYFVSYLLFIIIVGGASAYTGVFNNENIFLITFLITFFIALVAVLINYFFKLGRFIILLYVVGLVGVIIGVFFSIK